MTTTAESATTTAFVPLPTFSIVAVDSGSYSNQILYADPSSSSNVKLFAPGQAPDNTWSSQFHIDSASGRLITALGTALCAAVGGFSGFQNPTRLYQCPAGTVETSGVGAKKVLRCTQEDNGSLVCTMTPEFSAEFKYQLTRDGVVNVAYTQTVSSYTYLSFKVAS
ncbi:hypothetical protein QQX98_004172 [Neonectria punicea]|uniref:Ig-like domain-containing protein n=1 Tax=Neonectria punicea TaxID=979145 RepID=A0ABR1HA70_9HYPO